MKRSRCITATICIAAAAAIIWLTMSADTASQRIVKAEPFLPNSPTGNPKGIYPGRVVWIHDPNATDQNCTNTYNGDGVADENDDGWFCSHNNDQNVIDIMLSKSLRCITGQNSDYDAWDALFIYFNQQHGKGSVGYAAGEKIMIKTNITSSWGWGQSWGNINTDYSKKENGYYGVAETSPHITLAFVRQLVNIYGIDQQDIYIGDPMKHIYKHIYDMIHAEFPDIVFIDHNQSLSGRTPIVQSTTQIRYSDGTTTDYLPTCIADADYMINIGCLKGHARAGITLCAKNHFGSTMREDASHMHYGLVNPDGIAGNSDDRFDYGLYRIQVDLMGHEKLGQNTVLHVVDALWAGPEAIGLANKWVSPPFNNDYTSSLFMSQDQVALESVCHDFLSAEYTTANGYTTDTWPNMPAVDDYLQQAADPNYWPTSFTYDPENDGSTLSSMGVHEHWNNAADKQYSRNLDPVGGTGIELINQPTPTGDFDKLGNVNLEDFAILADAWGAAGTDINWNPTCDISLPSDNVIDIYDLFIFCENWLK